MDESANDFTFHYNAAKETGKVPARVFLVENHNEVMNRDSALWMVRKNGEQSNFVLYLIS
ncbi:MAG TPA: hypothetical protein DEQ02_05940 [Ruminococcaceae bacterium]|nr:hypothetical protein [Oscillospiraceae bacterium]